VEQEAVQTGELGAPGDGMEGDRTKRAHDELPLRAHAHWNENGTAGGGGALLLPGRRRGPAHHVSAAGLPVEFEMSTWTHWEDSG
jgi:hypothetical protein